MDIRYRALIALFFITLICGMGWSAFWHHSQYVQADTARIAALMKAENQQQTIEKLTAREKVLTDLEVQHAQELADARAMIQHLQTSPENRHL